MNECTSPGLWRLIKRMRRAAMAEQASGSAGGRVRAPDLQAFVEQLFQRCGMEEQDARLLAETLVTSDLRGVHSHGVLRVPEYVRKLTREGVDPRGRPVLAGGAGACRVVDGGNSMGQIGMQFATERTLEAAEAHGIAAVAVRGSNHCGALAYFAMQALPRDMIGFATTHAMPTMAPWGGAERLLGINPIAIAVPAGEELPVVYDAAFSASSHGKIRVYQQEGRPLPEGWALDREGRPTTDPAAAMEGLLQPIGGFKGVGLAMIAGMLCSFLSGARYGTELGSMEAGPRAGEDGHFVGALRVSAFEAVDRFKARVDAAVRQLHACRRAPGFEHIYAPGEREALTQEAYAREGIPLNAAILADLREVGGALGVDPLAWQS
jgi:LDH2 family malate/lactate/ureidoglycolate dehydrogenase